MVTSGGYQRRTADVIARSILNLRDKRLIENTSLAHWGTSVAIDVCVGNVILLWLDSKCTHHFAIEPGLAGCDCDPEHDRCWILKSPYAATEDSHWNHWQSLIVSSSWRKETDAQLSLLMSRIFIMKQCLLLPPVFKKLCCFVKCYLSSY